MIHLARKTILISVMGAGLMLGGCASVDDVKRAQATADHAQATADQALAAAHAAQQTADQAMSAAQGAQHSVDEWRSQQTTVHRGPRG